MLLGIAIGAIIVWLIALQILTFDLKDQVKFNKTEIDVNDLEISRQRNASRDLERELRVANNKIKELSRNKCQSCPRE